MKETTGTGVYLCIVEGKKKFTIEISGISNKRQKKKFSKKKIPEKNFPKKKVPEKKVS